MIIRRKRLIGQHLLNTCLVFALVISGCGGKYGPVVKTRNDHAQISKAHSEFSSLANSSDLPIEYVSEGKIGVTKVEAVLETADAVDLHARAELDKQLADFSAQRIEVKAQANKSLTEAENLREQYNTEYGKAMSEISAREAKLSALIDQKEIIIASLTEEDESKRNDIIVNAREKLKSETARIEQLKEIHSAIEVESNAKILEMAEASRATRGRAAAVVLELEAEARAVKLETQARVDELKEKIKSAAIQTKSEADTLNASREAILKNANAHVKELRNKAVTIQANLVSEEYQLKLVKAASVKAESQAQTQEKSANAPTRLEKAMAEINRLRGEVNHYQDNSVANYGSMLAEIQAKLDNELNEVKKLRISSDRVEQVARAEFVKVEAGARAEAIRQTAIHAEAVAEAEKVNIIAEAEAEATRIKQEVLDEIAAKKASNNVTIDNYTTEVSQQGENLHEVPEVPQVEAVAAKIEAEHILKYRTSFAEIMRTRAQANAHELVARATFAEAKTNLLAVKTQQDAIASEQLAIADALEAQARARFTEIEIKTEKEMDISESKYRQQLVFAESFRQEKEAEASDYQSQATAMEQISNARAQQLLAESKSVSKCGENDIKELKVNLWAIQQRGDAQYSKFLTEAQSVSDSQEALALQIDAQVDSAQRYLEAELSKISNSIASAEKIAQVDYQQSLTQANVLRQKIEAEISRTNAQFTMEHAISKAQIERDKELVLNQTLRGKAVCERMIASANTDKICYNADLDAKYATAQANMNIVLASNSAKRDAAGGYLDAVKARFNARIEQVKAERVIVTARELNATALRQTDLATVLARAMAAREESSRKLATLQRRQAELQTASMTNWSNKLATFKNGTKQLKTAEIDFSFSQVADKSESKQAPAIHKATWSFDDTE